MSLYRLDTSIRVQGSHSRAIADIVKQEWWRARPGDPVIRRHVGVDPIPATAWATAVFAGRTPPESLTEEQQAALALASTLADELIAADALLFACLSSQARSAATACASSGGHRSLRPWPGQRTCDPVPRRISARVSGGGSDRAS